ncbi:MAG TPA: DUF2207 domain-containing protein [Nocardioides sp.]|nr:DUF2207 domain-containing protein [Nocardioides sp.]
MKRAIAALVVFGVLAAVLCWPAIFYSVHGDTGDPSQEITWFTSYKADFDVHEDGSMDVVQTIAVQFPTGDKHGIFEFFDRLDASDAHVRHEVEDVKVTRDGQDEPFSHSVEDGRFDVYKIGDANVTLAYGEHTYRISYHVDAALAPGGEDVDTPAQLYWQLVPGGWLESIDKAKLTVHLPAAAQDVQCGIGWGSDPTPCKYEGDGTQDLTVTTGHIDAQTPVTLLVGQDVQPPEQTTLPWTGRWDRVVGRSVPVAIGIGVATVLLGLLGFLLAWMTFERPPRFPLMYGPPDGIGPAQAAYILTESHDRKQYVASLLHAAEHGALTLTPGKDSWTITDKSGPQGWAGLDPLTTSVAGLLSGPGSSFTAGKKDVSAGLKLKNAMSSFDSAVSSWAKSSGFLTKAGIGGLGGFLALVALIAVGAIAIWHPFDVTFLGLPAAAFFATGVPMWATGASTKRTATGRDLWARIGGFKRILSTTSAEDRFDFSGRKELYTAYIPWAVAFGCAKEWAQKYRLETGEEPPVPVYFAGYGFAGGYDGQVDSIVDSFDSTLSGAISAYNATQSSSSSGGGGGFSGGGGGGGGGGGSW